MAGGDRLLPPVYNGGALSPVLRPRDVPKDPRYAVKLLYPTTYLLFYEQQ
jgi:hypothetical protein